MSTSDELSNRINERLEHIGFEKLEVKIESHEVPSGQVSVRTLTGILGGLQELTDSIANTILNQPSSRGPIPQEILDNNTWILRTVKAGAFIAVIDLKHENQLSFEVVPQYQIISELYNLLRASDEEESLLEIISGLGSRALKNYAEWTKSIRDLDAPLELNWISGSKEIDRIALHPDKANEIFTILSEKLSAIEEEVTLQGRLTGVNVRTSTFELYINDGEKLTGRIIKDIVPSAVGFLDKKCEVNLLKVNTESTGGNKKVSWTLNNINELK